MCGRFDQSQTARHYASAFGWADAVFDSESAPTTNAAPGTYRPVLHMQDGEHRVDDVFWSYRPKWAEGKIPIAINARLEKLGSSYWSRLLKNGRGVVPAEGWYEWTGEKGHKQPWHIHRKDHAPLWLSPALTPQQAVELARHAAMPPDAFDWHKVSKKVNNASAHGPQIALPLDDEEDA
jgi:putative SOS response-associated peptidase YedK